MSDLARPASPAQLFRVFNRLALQGFGGVLAVAQRELVERQRWLSRPDFLEIFSTSQVLPGPNIVNMALVIGDRFHGTRGAFAALAGLMAAPTLVVLLLSVLYQHFGALPAVAAALRGMGAVAAGLIVATACKLLGGLRGNPLGPVLCWGLAGLTLLCIGVARWPLAAVVLGLGGTAVYLAWLRLRA